MNRVVYLVTADHVSPKYACRDHEITVSDGAVYDHDTKTEWRGFFADSPKYGCGKTYRSAREAVVGMLSDHACTNIRMRTKGAAAVKREPRSIRYVILVDGEIAEARGVRKAADKRARLIETTWQNWQVIEIIDSWHQHAPQTIIRDMKAKANSMNVTIRTAKTESGKTVAINTTHAVEGGREGYTLNAAGKPVKVFIPTRTEKEIMEDHDFELWSTGGGCTAWCKKLGDGSYIMICNDENGHDGDPDAKVWWAGRHDNEDGGFVEACVDMTMHEALALCDVLPHPHAQQVQWFEKTEIERLAAAFCVLLRAQLSPMEVDQIIRERGQLRDYCEPELLLESAWVAQYGFDRHGAALAVSNARTWDAALDRAIAAKFDPMAIIGGGAA